MPDSRLQRLPARHHRERTATMRAKSASAPTNQSQMVSVTTNGTARLLFHSISRRTALRGVGASLITSAAAALGRSTAAAASDLFVNPVYFGIEDVSIPADGDSFEVPPGGAGFGARIYYPSDEPNGRVSATEEQGGWG